VFSLNLRGCGTNPVNHWCSKDYDQNVMAFEKKFEEFVRVITSGDLNIGRENAGAFRSCDSYNDKLSRQDESFHDK
jgi:hypothetical protein